MPTTCARLDEISATLPSAFYFDREHHERELGRIWYRQPSNRHKSGVLVPQEIFVRDFHDWVREQLNGDGNG